MREITVTKKTTYTANHSCYDCTAELYGGMDGEVCFLTGANIVLNVRAKTFHKDCPMVEVKGEE